MIQFREKEIYQTPPEQEILRACVRETETVPGVIAEVGVFQGCSAAIIREESKKELWLFDTFQGFADELSAVDPKSYFVGDCAAGVEHVEELFRGDKGVSIVTGKFPDTAGAIKDKTFSFVHLDVDIYNPTKAGLEFFYPRLNKGGIILVHDYPAHDGVRLAVDEFMAGKSIQRDVVGGRQLLIKKP